MIGANGRFSRGDASRWQRLQYRLTQLLELLILQPLGTHKGHPYRLICGRSIDEFQSKIQNQSDLIACLPSGETT
jgi:hypothetical protein